MTPSLPNPAAGHKSEDSASPAVLRNARPETRTDYPREKTIVQLFEEVAARYPSKIALVSGARIFSYSELNARANYLAADLRRWGVGPESMVGCCIERSLEMIVSFVAILKAGGAYVPFDPSYPKDRIDYMLAETHTPVMLCQRSLATAVGDQNTPVICVDEVLASASALQPENPSAAGTATNLAYVMYTSGSTGQPKGVMVENRAVVRLVRNTNFCNLGSDEVFLQFAPVSFDASTLEIWGPLLNGGKLVLMPPGAASLDDLGRAIREYGVTTIWLTSGLFNLMVEQKLEDLRPIRQLLAGGDVLSARHVRKVLENLPDCTVINGYGPTENTTFTCCHVMRPGERIPEAVPVGKPISNTCVYILDENLRPVPPRTTGELHAGGDGVARGYLNDPEKTREKFLPDPFSSEPGARMYRTGDLAQWRDDGVVEFLGRIDNQIKIHGYRIEPGEIEVALRTHESVEQAYVVARTDESGLKCLVAYFKSAKNKEIAPGELKQFLSGKIPPYMLPALFVRVDNVPLSPNGKVDRGALPVPVFESEASPAASAAATGLEQKIADVWKRILRLERVGLDDNFFDLGGDSLLLIAVQSNLQKSLELEIPIMDFFEFTTIRSLASRLSKPRQPEPSFADVQLQAQRQRDAFTRERERRTDGAS